MPAVITQQALLPDASSMFFTPSSRLLMFIKDSVYGIFVLPQQMLCSHFPEIWRSLRVSSAKRPGSRGLGLAALIELYKEDISLLFLHFWIH